MPTRFDWNRSKLRNRGSLIAIGLALMTLGSRESWAQDDPYQALTATQPSLSPRDENGVDLISGKINIDVPLLSVSPSATSLTLKLQINGPGDWPTGGASVASTFATVFRLSHNFVSSSSAPVTPDLGLIAFISTPVGSGAYRGSTGWAITNPDGTKFQPSLGPNNLTYFHAGPYEGIRTADGTRVEMATTGCCMEIASRVDFPSGEVWRSYIQNATIGGSALWRLRSITTNRGYTYEIEYDSDVPSSGTWDVPKRALVFNKSQVYCNEAALALCSNANNALDYVDFVYDNVAKTVTFRHKGETGGLRIGFKPESWGVSTDVQSVSQSDVPNSTVSYTYAAVDEQGNDPYYERHVASVTRPDGVWNYSYYRVMHEGRVTAESRMDVTGPLGTSRSAVGNLSFGLMDWITEPLGRNFSQGYDVTGALRITDDAQPEGNGRHYQHDYRGNITKLQYLPKPGSPDAVREITATYPSDCMNPKTCNRPLTTTDARGATTTFTYDPTHGSILTKTLPAVGGVSPVTRYSYVQRYPWLMNSSGSFSPGAEPIWLLAEERACRTTATVGNACAGGVGDEVAIAYDYGPNSGPNNLLLRGIAVTADGQTRRTCYGNSNRGDRISETSPRATLTSCP